MNPCFIQVSILPSQHKFEVTTGSCVCRQKWTFPKLENTKVCRNGLKYKLKIDIIVFQCLPLHTYHNIAKLLRYICSTEGARIMYLFGCHQRWSLCSHTGEVLGIGEKNVHFNPFGEKKVHQKSSITEFGYFLKTCWHPQGRITDLWLK